jgi:hypothetical protein
MLKYFFEPIATNSLVILRIYPEYREMPNLENCTFSRTQSLRHPADLHWVDISELPDGNLNSFFSHLQASLIMLHPLPGSKSRQDSRKNEKIRGRRLNQRSQQSPRL